MLVEEELTAKIIGAAMEVHKQLGPGLLESAYEECLCCELDAAGLAHRRQVELPLVYRDLRIPIAYRLDIVVNDTVLLELKAVDKILAVHEAQLLTYLRLSKLRVGLLINFNVALLKEGITRRVL